MFLTIGTIAILYQQTGFRAMTGKVDQSRKWKFIARSGCAILILAHAVLSVISAASNSVTFDEYAHLPAGVAYWKQGWPAFAMHNLSPPLARLVAAAPVVIAGVESPDVRPDLAHGPQNAHWDYGKTFERANASRYQRLFVIGRLGLLPVSCLGLWLVWKWAGELYGAKSALAAGVLWAFNPDLIAHGSLVGTDAFTAVAMLAATYLWWKFFDGHGQRKLWLILGAVAFAAAQLSKFTAMILVPMLAVMAICRIADRTITWRRALIGLLTCAALSWIAINAIYGFRGTFTRFSAHQFQSRPMPTLQSALPKWWPSLLPREYLRGFDIQKFETESGVLAFVLGDAYRWSRWYYYPVALASKLPVGAIGLILLSIGFLVAKPQAAGAGEISLLAALGVFLLLVIVLADVNIGVRYILPAYPLAIVLISRIWRDRAETVRSFWSTQRVGWALLSIMMGESLLAAPRYLSFINFAAGGQTSGWRIVNDSNFDWGQGLLDLRRWLDAHGNPPIAMAYFGRVNPRVYGINYSPITAPGDSPLVAVSTYYLNGLTHRLPTDDGATSWVSLPYARELREIEPLDRAGPTIYIYRATDVALAARRARNR
ncbi:MAG: glycosyltransferase family 39 protein [Burkholderiales bacterium]|nr:glycosyltransferase family 39 protein [Phycisphaerae bacterium]